MSRYTITPWRTQADLLSVRAQLYTSNECSKDVRRTAVDRVQAWKLRGNLPHAVESTALLVEAILHHDIKANSLFSIRAVYSAAFMRFVTGFCDIGRHKERALEPSSMLDIAKQIGMPVEFVTLRHEATHEELPGLRRLVDATQKALEWLWKVYWSRLEEPRDEVAVKAEMAEIRAEAAALLREFRRARRDALRANIHVSTGQPGDVGSTGASCVEICKGGRTATEVFAGILVEDRLILPSNRELNSSLDGAYLIWDNLLIAVSSNLQHFLPAFVASLLQRLALTSAIDPSRDVDKEAFAMWLLHVMSSNNTFIIASHDQKTLLAEVMKWCCLHPGHWPQRIGSELLDQNEDGFKAEWEDLFEASLIGSEEYTGEAVPGAALGDTQQSIVGDNGTIEMADSWSRAVAPTSVPIGVVQ